MSDNKIVGQGTSAQAWMGSRHLADLPVLDIANLLRQHSRAVIVSPHPDDEVLGFGGLLQHLQKLGMPVALVMVTCGEACYPGSKQWSPQRLRQVRPEESREALRQLGWHDAAQLDWHWLGLPDSGVEQVAGQLANRLEQLIRPDDCVFTTWSEDGHCDHETVGRTVTEIARQQGASVHEVPIWAWHWAAPEDPRIPWQRARRLNLDSVQLARKYAALHAFGSQLSGAEDADLLPILSSTVLARARMPFEVIFL